MIKKISYLITYYLSLIVLSSHGQGPAEFENHFGRGLKLPRNAEICLCGANLNRYNKQDEAFIIQDNNSINSIIEFLNSNFLLVKVWRKKKKKKSKRKLEKSRRH